VRRARAICLEEVFHSHWARAILSSPHASARHGYMSGIDATNTHTLGRARAILLNKSFLHTGMSQGFMSGIDVPSTFGGLPLTLGQSYFVFPTC
jgi:hypothetical protein